MSVESVESSALRDKPGDCASGGKLPQNVDAAGSSEASHAPALLAKALAARQRKIEKDLRRKRYDDLQVQGTNNSSIVSKRLVEMLYYRRLRPQETSWFECFVAKPKTRLPSINRGYLIRMETVRRSIENIIGQHENAQVRVVNLGCGFDPLAYQLLETFENRVYFVDVDYPELVENKLRMMRDSPKIMDIVGPATADACGPSTVFHTKNYALVGCDLKDLVLYENVLHTACGHAQVTIFIAEVSLAYMKPQDADNIIALLAKVPKSHILVLEQILPYGRSHVFAQKMLAHFKKLRSPIQCVEKYPSRALQQHRFEQCYRSVHITDLFENWQGISDAEKRTISAVEDFDEWEEFILFCHHYVLIHAYTDETFRGETIRKPAPVSYPAHPSLAMVGSEHGPESALLLKFPAVCALDKETVFVHGGAHQCRSDSTLLVTAGSKAGVKECGGDKPTSRMCHSATPIDGGVLVVGGRTRPRAPCGDAHFYKNGKWAAVASPIAPRARHCAVAVDGRVLVFGGLEDNRPLQDLFECYDPATNTWQRVRVAGVCPPNLRAAAMAYNGTSGIIFGGYDQGHEPVFNAQAYSFVFDGSQVHLTAATLPDEIGRRIGSQCAYYDRNTLVIVGGIGAGPLPATVCTVDLSSGLVSSVSLDAPGDTPPMLIGHGMACVEENGQEVIKVVCGGAVCYSFGSAYSGIYTIAEKKALLVQAP